MSNLSSKNKYLSIDDSSLQKPKKKKSYSSQKKNNSYMNRFYTNSSISFVYLEYVLSNSE